MSSSNRFVSSSRGNRSILRNSRPKASAEPQLEKHQLIMLKQKLNAFVKSNDLGQLFGKEDIYLKANMEGYEEYDEKLELHQTLKELKTKHDIIFENCQKKEKEITQMKVQIRNITANETKLKIEEDEVESQLKKVRGELQSIEQKLAEAHSAKQSYQHVLKRMKKDELIHQKNSYSVEKKLKLGKVRLIRNKEHLIASKREEEETKHALKLAQKKIKEEQVSKEFDLKRIRNIVMKKKFLEKKHSERVRKQKEVAENAANESKDANEKKWRRLMMAHKFFAFFLKKKMDRELNRFKTVEKAFRSIKSSTVKY